MEFKDYYKILGVEPDADDKAIKTAYRRLARKYHPDISQEKDAENRFKEMAEAYEVLRDPKKRAEYDELRLYGGRQGQTFTPPPGWQSTGPGNVHFEHFEGDFSDFFETLFGAGGAAHGQHPRGSRGQDVDMELPIFLEETLSETSKPIRFAVPTYDAQGRRTGSTTRNLNVTIPKGVNDSQRIRLQGQGAPGVGNGPNGDLYLHIRLVPHPLFDVEGHNLVITVPLTPWEAALGDRITVPTLSGKIQLSIPAGSQSGQRLRIKGKGLPRPQGHGDLYALLKVVMPPRTDDDIRRLWQQLGEKAGFDPRQDWRR